MRPTIRRFVVAAAVAAALAASGAARAQDAATVLKNRQDAMKAQGTDMGAVKAFTEGKGDLPAAQAAGDDLVKRIAAIPGLFPPNTGMAEFPDKSYARPAIWADADKFAAAVKTAQDKANALDAALKDGDKDKITAAFGDMGKNGCGGCHTPFREPKKT
jgi:cytochrome c556